MKTFFISIPLIFTQLISSELENKKEKKSTIKSEHFRKKATLEAIKTAKLKIKKEFKLECIGIGIGGDYEQLSLDFRYFTPITLNEARNMVLATAEVFGECLHTSRDRYCLENEQSEKYPAAIIIYFKDRSYQHFSDPYICVAALHSEGLEYLIKGHDQEFGYKETIEETLEEAEAKNQTYLRQLQTTQEQVK